MRLRLCKRDRAIEGLDVVRVFGPDLDRLPSVRLEPRTHVFGERERRRPRQRDLVVVVQHDQLAEREVSRERGRLRCDTLHQITVPGEDVRMMIDDRLLAVVGGGEMRFGDREADGIADSLTERAGRYLNAGRVMVLGMARCAAEELAERLEIVEREVIAREVQQRVQECRAVPGAEDEAIAIEPLRIGGIVTQVPCPQGVGDGRGTKRQAGMSRVRLLHGIDREKTDGVDVKFFRGRIHVVSW